MQHCIALNANNAIGCGISRRVSNLDKCRPEPYGDIISGVALDYVDMDVPTGFGECRLNIGQIIRLFVRPDQFCVLFVQYLIIFCYQPEAASDVISDIFVALVVLDRHVKFYDPSLNHSGEIPLLFPITSDWK